MKQFLFLFLLLLPCLALAQYPSNGNQKITLGEQTTADGIIWRGVSSDTTLTAKSDTAAYFVLDTVNKKLYFYKVSATPKWNEISGSGGGGAGTVTSITGGTGLTGGTITTSGTLAADTNFIVTRYDTSSMLTNYYRSGRALGTPLSGVLTTATGLPLTTGVTGTLAVANGGTNATTLTANKVMVGNGTSGVLTPTNLHWDNTNSRLGIGTTVPRSAFEIVDGSPNTNGDTPAGMSVVGPNQTSTSSAANFLLTTNNTFGIDIGASIGFGGRAAGNTQGAFLAGISGRKENSNTTDYAGYLQFITRNTGANSTEKMRITSVGNVGIGTTNPQSGYRLHVVDSVYVGGNVSAAAYTTRSDFNLKDDIFDLKYGLNDILKLQPVEYIYKSNGSKQLGFIAQDIGTILPEVVSFEESMSVNYQAIIPILTKAIQEQQTLIKALEQRIINLENK